MAPYTFQLPASADPGVHSLGEINLAFRSNPLLSHLDTTCSLTDLARRVGISEFALEKGFRELFGTTVFGFWHEAKMEQVGDA